MATKPQPDPRIAAYVAELETPSVVSYSHITLHRLNQQYGYQLITNLLDAHWAAVRAADNLKEQAP